MINEVEEGDSVSLSVSIYPPDGGSGVIRQIGFNIGGTVSILTEIGLDEDGDPAVRLTVGGGPQSTVEGLEEIADTFDTISELLRSEEFQTGWQVARDKQLADEAIEQAYEDDDDYVDEFDEVDQPW
jgi:hypothetical protein